MKLLIKFFDFGNRDRLLLGVIGSLADSLGIMPYILRFSLLLVLALLSLIDNFLGTAIILYVAAYLSSAFVTWLYGVDNDDLINFKYILFANWIAKH